MKAVLLISIAILAAAVLWLFFRDSGSVEESASSVDAPASATAPDAKAFAESCSEREGVQAVTYAANCDISFVGFTVPVTMTVKVYGVSGEKTLAGQAAPEIVTCTELSISDALLRAVGAARAEPEVREGVMVLAASNASPKLVAQPVLPQPIGRVPVRSEVVTASLQAAQAGEVSLVPRGMSFDLSVTFTGGAEKPLKIEVPSRACPKGFEPVGDSKALTFEVAADANPGAPVNVPH